MLLFSKIQLLTKRFEVTREFSISFCFLPLFLVTMVLRSEKFNGYINGNNSSNKEGRYRSMTDHNKVKWEVLR